MTKTLTLALAAAGLMLTGVAVPAAAHDNGYRYNGGYSQYDNGYGQYDGHDRRRYRNGRCDNGRGGTIIGAVAGGLAGREVAGRGDKTVGTIIGGALGALAGRAIDKSNDGCRR
jgi:outer membrane lipoprotein SlyB